MLNRQSNLTIFENDDFRNYYDKHIYFFQYEGIIRSTILNYKFNDKSYLYKTFVNFMIKNEKFCSILKSYDIIIPVPISSKRNKQRGYNQSYLIARQLSKELGIMLICDCLYKSKNIVEQSKLTKEARQENIKGAYTLYNLEKLQNKKIVLLDDIFTTGSTANECCKTLRQAKVKEICILTLAKD